MGAVEHLETLCCLGLPPESAMIAVTPLLHEIILYGWSRVAFLAPDGTITGGWSEHPEAPALYRERAPPFLNDPSSLLLARPGSVGPCLCKDEAIWRVLGTGT